jgi:hypothetical protein
MSLPFSPRKESTVELYPKRNEFGVAKKRKAMCAREMDRVLLPFIVHLERNTL